MGLLGRLLDVLRIVVAAADDDHVLHAAGDKQLAVAEEAQVAGPQESCPRGRDLRAEHLLGFFRRVPIALRHRRTLNQNLADLAVRTLDCRLRLDDDDRVIASSAGPQPTSRCVISSGSPHAGTTRCSASAARFTVQNPSARADSRARPPAASIPPVRSTDRTPACESRPAERFGKMLERFRANRLGAAERQPPTAQIERRPLFGRRAAHAILVGEIRRAADRSPGNRESPAATASAAARTRSATSARCARPCTAA